MSTVTPKARRRAILAETDRGRVRRARRMQGALAQRYPYADCELDFKTPLQLLVATVISAQTTDVTVNKVTPALFAKYPTVKDLASAKPEDMEKILHPTGFFRAKTHSVITLSQALLDKFGGEVPKNLKDLVSLPGVGRKTANVVLGHAFGIPGITVDTHVARLSQRFAWTTETDPVAIEKDLMKLFKRADWTRMSDDVIFHGRRTCHARKPACGACPIVTDCPSYGEGETDPEAARKLLTYELAPGAQLPTPPPGPLPDDPYAR